MAIKWRIDYAVNGKPTFINIRRNYKDNEPLGQEEAMNLIRKFVNVSAAKINIIKISERQ